MRMCKTTPYLVLVAVLHAALQLRNPFSPRKRASDRLASVKRSPVPGPWPVLYPWGKGWLSGAPGPGEAATSARLWYNAPATAAGAWSVGASAQKRGYTGPLGLGA